MSESLRSLCTEKNPLGRHWDELPGALFAQKHDRMPIIGPSRAGASAARFDEEGLQWTPVDHAAAGGLRCT